MGYGWSVELLPQGLMSSPNLNDSARAFRYAFATGALAANRTVTFPVLTGNANFVFDSFLNVFTVNQQINANLIFGTAARDIVGQANTVNMIRITDGTTAIVAFDSRTGTDNVNGIVFRTPNATFAGVAGTTDTAVQIVGSTFTTSAQTTITNMTGISLYVGGGTIIQSGGAVAITTASSVWATATAANASVTITNNSIYYAANPAAPAGTFTNLYGMYIENITRGGSNYALSLQNNIQLRAAVVIVATANAASALQITDGANAYYTIDTRGSTGISAHTFGVTPPSFASATGNSYNLVTYTAFTMTQTGTTLITALNGLSLTIGSPTVTNTSAGLTITTVSAVQLNGPLPAGNATFTNSIALDIPTYVTNGTTASGIRIAAPSGAATNYALNITSGTTALNGQVLGANGTVGAPTYSWLNKPNSGFYSIGGNDTYYSWNGNATVLLTNGMQVVSGGSYSFSSSSSNPAAASDVQFYRVAPGVGGFGGVGAMINPALQFDSSIASSVTGLLIKANISNSGLALSVIGGAAAENLTIDAKGAGTITFAGTSTGNVIFGRLTSIAPAAVAGGATTLSITSGAHTAVVAEVIDINMVAHTTTITGSYATQRSVVFASPTYSGAFTLTTVIGISVTGPLPAGGATFTNTVAMDFPTFATNGTTASTIRIAAPTGAGTNWAINITTGGITVAGASTIAGLLTASAGITVTGAALTITDQNIVLSTVTGTRIGTAAGQKLSFYSVATPIVQITTAVTAAAFVANTSGTVNDSATWGGYTIGQVVQALRNYGLLA